MKESDLQLFWYGEYNYQIIFTFGWMENLQVINNKWFLFLNHDFDTAIKLLGN